MAGMIFLGTIAIIFPKNWLRNYLVSIYQSGSLEPPIYLNGPVVVCRKDLNQEDGQYKRYSRKKVTNSKIT